MHGQLGHKSQRNKGYATAVGGLLEYDDTKITYIFQYNPNMDEIKYNARFVINELYSEKNPSGINPINHWAIVESKKWIANVVQQKLTSWFTPDIVYIRHFQNEVWTPWYKLQ